MSISYRPSAYDQEHPRAERIVHAAQPGGLTGAHVDEPAPTSSAPASSITLVEVRVAGE